MDRINWLLEQIKILEDKHESELTYLDMVDLKYYSIELEIAELTLN